MRCISVCALLMVAGMVLGGCERVEIEVEAGSDTNAAQLPISHNEVMVALVNHAADPIWVAAWRG